MDNFLEKLTLYDLVGYTIPGTLCVLIFGGYIWGEKISDILKSNIFSEYKIYIILGLLIMGYLAGIIVTEIGDWAVGVLKKLDDVEAGIGYEKIGYDLIKAALVESGAISVGASICMEEDVDIYMGYMYGELQTDSKYSRLHNYASMELLCQNMLIATAALIAWWVKAGFTYGIVGGLFVEYLFYRRWKLCYQRKKFYVAAWFVQKHQKM